MALLFSKDNLEAVPISYEFVYGAATTTWGDRLNSVSPVNSSSELEDGGYRIGDLTAEFIDTDGSLWGSLGHGTSCLGSNFYFSAYVGGTMEFAGFHDATRWQRLNTGNSGTYRVHSGKITKVTRSNRLVKITSKNNMRLLSEMRYNFPFATSSEIWTPLGSYFFKSGNLRSGSYSKSCFNLSDDNKEFSVIAAISTTAVSNAVTTYGDVASRGTETLPAGSGYAFLGSTFIYAVPQYRFSGSYLGTFIGTVDNEEEAVNLGYANVAAAEAAKTFGSYYMINKTRLNARGASFSGSHFLYQQSQLVMEGNPATIFKELLTGAVAYPYFTFASDMDNTGFSELGSFTAFSSFRGDLNPETKLVIGDIKNFMESIGCLFAVTTENKFRPVAYGPKNLVSQSFGSFGTNDVIDSEVSNSIEDFRNRIEYNYDYDPKANSYRKRFGTTLPGWAVDNDRPFIVESKWLRNDNEAQVQTARLITQLRFGIPRYEIDLSLNKLDVEVGSLYVFSDPNTLTSGGTKIVQVVGFDKDFNDSRRVRVTARDGELLTIRRGYAFWGTKTALPGDAGMGTHTAIWSQTLNGFWYEVQGIIYGTAAGINTELFGTKFVYW